MERESGRGERGLRGREGERDREGGREGGRESMCVHGSECDLHVCVWGGGGFDCICVCVLVLCVSVCA